MASGACDKFEFPKAWDESKHLKGQLDPPVSDVKFFASKEVGWIPLSVT